MDASLLRARSSVLTRTRDFFLSRGYLETDTPLLSPALIPEACLEVFKTEFLNPFLGRAELYLAPSPELWMKRVIAETRTSLFQVCKCFRNSETIGRFHNPEFTMLEYYAIGSSSADNIGLTEELFAACALPETPASAKPPFRVMSMAEAFREQAGMDLAALQDAAALAEAARSRGLITPEPSSWESIFNSVFLSLVEPGLPQDRPLALTEYPAQIDCLARNVPGTPWKDRWELYARGMELANCYGEEGDEGAVRAYFEREGARKAGALVPHPADMDFPRIFGDFPPCSGVALGFDRFVAALAGASSLDEILLFPFSGIIKPRLILK
jgi:elongation factor P--(R)-beta-lysine ligase